MGRLYDQYEPKETGIIGYGFKLNNNTKGSGTDSSQAITMHQIAGTITSSTTNLGTDADETITVTNNYCEADSIVICMADGGGAGTPVVGQVTPAAGSFTVTTRNVDDTNACDAAYKIRFVIM